MKINHMLIVVFVLFISLNTTLFAKETIVKDGEKIAFMGDSITAYGWNNSVGYVKLVVAGLKANGIEVSPIPAGAGGHNSHHMLQRLDRDALQKKPAWMTLSCGVNDVWHGARGIKLADYKKNITAIVDRCQVAGVKVLILTPTMIGEQDNPHWNALNKTLDGYVAFLKILAKKKGLPIADLNGAMKQALKEHKMIDATKRVYLTKDGVHMNPLGDIVMAKGVLRSIGFDDAMIESAEIAWDKRSVTETIRMHITLEQYKKYSQLSTQKKQAIYAGMKGLIVEAVK